MDEKRKEIEEIVRKCTNRLGSKVTENQIQSMTNRLVKMKDIKEVVDSLALNIDRFFASPEQKEQFDTSLEDLLQFSEGSYESKEEIIAQVQRNKAKNYIPGNISVEENHKLIENTLKTVCDKLNELEVDYYLVGALASFIGTHTPLFRYHGDIDFMVAEKDIEKVREALEGTEYIFEDDRLDNKKRLEDGVGHTQGEHEVIANHKNNEFHLGFFLFRREEDKSITIREYFMQENENGEKVPMVLERNCPAELVELEYTQTETEFAGTKFRTSTPESVYCKKMYTNHPKDILDIKALSAKIDKAKIKEMQKYHTSLNIVGGDKSNNQKKETEVKPTDSDIKEWSEGNEHLQKVLESCRENDVPSMFCCAGHGKHKPAYVTMKMNKETMEKIYSIMNSVSDKKNIAFRFSEKEFGKDPNFTIYMLNSKERDSIMDSIADALTREEKLENLPQDYQTILQMNHILTENEVGFEMEYDIRKKNNIFFFENFRFGNSEWIKDSDLEKLGLKTTRDAYQAKMYYKRGISQGVKGQKFLARIGQKLNQIYDMDLEKENVEELTFNQKVAQKLSCNRFLRKLPFVDKFVQKQLNILPEAKRRKFNSKQQSKGRINS